MKITVKETPPPIPRLTPEQHEAVSQVIDAIRANPFGAVLFVEEFPGPQPNLTSLRVAITDYFNPLRHSVEVHPNSHGFGVKVSMKEVF